MASTRFMYVLPDMTTADSVRASANLMKNKVSEAAVQMVAHSGSHRCVCAADSGKCEDRAIQPGHSTHHGGGARKRGLREDHG